MLKKRYILGVSLMLGFMALLLADSVIPGNPSMPSPEPSASFVFSTGSGQHNAPSEQGTHFVAPGLNNVPVHMNVKDYHKFVYHPLTEKQHIERKTHSYIFFAETLPSIINLSKLQRLNI